MHSKLNSEKIVDRNGGAEHESEDLLAPNKKTNGIQSGVNKEKNCPNARVVSFRRPTRDGRKAYGSIKGWFSKEKCTLFRFISVVLYTTC